MTKRMTTLTVAHADADFAVAAIIALRIPVNLEFNSDNTWSFIFPTEHLDSVLDSKASGIFRAAKSRTRDYDITITERPQG